MPRMFIIKLLYKKLSEALMLIMSRFFEMVSVKIRAFRFLGRIEVNCCSLWLSQVIDYIVV